MIFGGLVGLSEGEIVKSFSYGEISIDGLTKPTVSSGLIAIAL